MISARIRCCSAWPANTMTRASTSGISRPSPPRSAPPTKPPQEATDETTQTEDRLQEHRRPLPAVPPADHRAGGPGPEGEIPPQLPGVCVERAQPAADDGGADHHLFLHVPQRHPQL